MGSKAYLGEFEQLVMLVVARLGPSAFGSDVSRELEEAAGRKVSRGALYTTFDRLKGKGLLDWSVEVGDDDRGGLPKRRFEVTPEGFRALREVRNTLLQLWHGLEDVMEETGS